LHTGSSFDIVATWADGIGKLNELDGGCGDILLAKYIGILQANTTQGTPKFIRTECA
jgi:hypothetical protein